MQTSFLKARYKNILLSHAPELDGGGTGCGQQFIPVVRALFGKVTSIFELCAGPGYIGFSLLSEHLCDRLCLSDVNPLAIDAIRETIAANKLEGTVRCFLSDGLKAIPKTKVFDLVIMNPPHYRGGVSGGIIANDVDWKFHKRFYSGIAKHLAPNGSILLLENYHGSTEHDFVPMIERAGLKIVQSFMHRHTLAAIANPYYFLWVKRQDGVWTGNSFHAGQTVNVSLPSAKTLQLVEHTKYVLQLFDKRDRDVGLKNSSGVKFFRLKPFVSIRKLRGTSSSLLFTTGDFILYDLETSERLLKVKVRLVKLGKNVKKQIRVKA